MDEKMSIEDTFGQQDEEYDFSHFADDSIMPPPMPEEEVPPSQRITIIPPG